MVLVYAADHIIIGSGVVNQTHLLPKIKQNNIKKLNNYNYYPAHPAHLNLEKTITAPALGDNMVLIGNLLFSGQIKRVLINKSKP